MTEEETPMGGTPAATPEERPEPLPRLPRPAPHKKRRGDRKEGRLLRTIQPMSKMMPFIMPQRCDACNTYADEFDVTEADAFCKEMMRNGYPDFSFLHVIVAAYVRIVSQKPAVNRFVSGQRIYARNNIEMTMTIKKEMSADSPDTCIKVIFEPDDTVADVYDKLNAVIARNKAEAEAGNSNFDEVADKFSRLPRFILRSAISFINWLDYHGWVPQALLDVSPFHGSMIVTSMGSLGIKPIYHHIYNFGNLPVFVAYGIKRTVNRVRRDGKTEQRRYIDMKVVTDERICDGFYYASVFKLLRKYVEHPHLLTVRPEQIFEDVD